MRQSTFGLFVDRKKRQAVRQLEIVKGMLERQGLKVENFLVEDDDGHEPYVFCYNPLKTGGFDGIRIYKIGDDICFRIQKESKTHPYGSAYRIPVVNMFTDFMSDHGVNERKAGEKIIEAVAKEVRKFFDKSVEAERSRREQELDKDKLGNMLVRGSGTDYSAMVFSKQ